MEFVALKRKDIRELQDLARKIWNENYQDMISRDQINYMLKMMYNDILLSTQIRNGHYWYLVRNDDQAIGYVHFYPKNGKIFLSKIYLDQPFQGKGNSSQIVDFIVNKANELNLPSIELTVNKNNKRAIGFYEKYGFQKIDEKVFDIFNGYVMDDFMYEYSIKKG